MDLDLTRKDARLIFEAGIEAVEPVKAVKSHVRRQEERLVIGDRTYDLDKYESVHVVGAGKAAAAMAQALEELLGERLTSGFVNVKYGHSLALRLVSVNEAGHPVPDESGLRGTRELMSILRRAEEKSLVIFLVSGGGSALLPAPAEGLDLEDERQSTQLLLASGAAIDEINAIRKHISRTKGGQMARLTYPATLISLILSDVIGDRLDSIASGPTVPDQTTFEDCLRILQKYAIAEKIPPAVYDHLRKGARGEIPETPKDGEPVFERTQNVIVGSSIQAVRAAREKAEALGYRAMILSTFIEGETREVAIVHAALAKEIRRSGNPIAPPACLVSGGETTVTVRGGGLGGRNQEFALAAAIEIAGQENVVILSGGTDGTDGPTDAAGAIADGTTIERAARKGLNAETHLRENDSYHFFQPLGDLLVTGPTLTNVMDLRLVLVR
jgi:glycerate 2-kinase